MHTLIGAYKYTTNFCGSNYRKVCQYLKTIYKSDAKMHIGRIINIDSIIWRNFLSDAQSRRSFSEIELALYLKC